MLTFGFLAAFAFLHNNALHKLSSISTTCIFLGYPTNHKGHRCLNLDTNHIIISRNVVFNKIVFPFGSMTTNKASSFSFLDNSEIYHPFACTPDLPPLFMDGVHHGSSSDLTISTLLNPPFPVALFCLPLHL